MITNIRGNFMQNIHYLCCNILLFLILSVAQRKRRYFNMKFIFRGVQALLLKLRYGFLRGSLEQTKNGGLSFAPGQYLRNTNYNVALS